MPRSQRRIIASIILLLFLAFWVRGAATLGSQLNSAPKWLTLIFYLVAGIGWAVPLKPVFNWMNSGPEES